MTVLTKRSEWRIERSPSETRYSSDLTPEEQGHARAAIRFLTVRLGGAAKLARALRSNLASVSRATGKGGKPSAGLALRAARLAGVPLEDVLSGQWPGDRCPHCGHQPLT